MLKEKCVKKARKCAYCGVVTEEVMYFRGRAYCPRCWQLITSNESLYGSPIVVIT